MQINIKADQKIKGGGGIAILKVDNNNLDQIDEDVIGIQKYLFE